ncbi:MAG: molybdenum ABC transporter ATP-binding protein [Steroidobacteraceae bacterium]
MLDVDLRFSRGGFALEAQFAAATPGVTALFGRSGCGKSTLVNLLAGLIPGARGRIELDGQVWFDSTRGTHVPAERRRIGYVFQDARLFPHYSVRGNLLYGAARAGAPGAFDDVVQLLGLETLLARRPGSLSGGERQRVALGRALLTAPQLLLLDEPLASLDAARRDEVLPYFERLRDHYSIPMVFVSHQFDEVLRLATQLVVLDQGRVAASGDLGSVSLSPQLRGIVGADAAGAVIEGVVSAVAPEGLATIRIGAHSQLMVPAQQLAAGQPLRLQLLARDLILALEEPRGISVRNHLRGAVRGIVADGGADLVEVEVDGTTLLARITSAATRELRLAPGVAVWVLVKAVSVSPHAVGNAAGRASPA